MQHKKNNEIIEKMLHIKSIVNNIRSIRSKYNISKNNELTIICDENSPLARDKDIQDVVKKLSNIKVNTSITKKENCISFFA